MKKDLNKFQNKLKKVVKKYSSEEQVFIPLRGFEKMYEISNFGRIKSIEKQIVKPSPKTGELTKFIFKEKILKPLFCGPSRRWQQYRLIIEPSLGKYKQFSAAKLMLSSFMNIDIKELPNNVFTKDKNALNIKLHNLSFYRALREVI